VSAGRDRETRRVVTLLFTDVTGSTAMGEKLDPEAYRGVMGRYFAAARAAVERHGGTVEKFVGDAVLAVFGIPEVHEDDALRAVRAAYELNDAVARLSDRLVGELDVRLSIRTGVNTGAVVAGAARAGGSFATGDAVNTAARLEQAAPSGEILLGATTYALVRDAVEAEAVGPVLAKGKSEPVPAYRLLRVLDAARGRRGRDDVALVGRARENRALDKAFTRTVTSGRSHRITVLGPAGIGKSRLVGEFLGRVGDRAAVAHGRCLSYGQGITYWPLIQALRDALRLSGTESPEITRYALTEALGRAPDRHEVVEPLMALLGKAGMPGGNEQTFWSVRRLVEELASQRPLVLSVDDLHWAEPALLQVLDRLGEEVVDLPLLLLCQARPELLELYTGWDSGAAGSTTVRLDPLSPAETTASVAALLGGDPPEGFADTVSEWSGGNPLFIEEIVAHLVESGVLERRPRDVWRVARPLDRAGAPPNVTALLASRLDGLPATERDLLERVSVIGLEFTGADVELLVEPPARREVGGVLTALTGRDLVRLVSSSEDDTWAFKHVLVRDAAYDGMAKSLRAELHERFADAVAAGDHAGDERAGFVAHHLEQAARYRRELSGHDPEAETLVDRAVESLVLAADQARDREREDTSISYLERAMALGPTTSTARRIILERQVVSCFEAGELDRLAGALDSFEAELDESAEQVDRVFLRTMRGVHEMSVGGAVDPAQVNALAEEVVAIGRAAGDTRWIVRGLRAQSLCSMVLALWGDAAAHSDEVIRIGSPADARSARSLHLVALTLGDGTLRDVRELIRHEATIDGNTPTVQLLGLLWDAIVAAGDGSPDAGELIAATEVRHEELYAAGTIGEPTLPLLADAYAMNRDLDGAVAYLQRVNDVFRRSGDLGHASTYILVQVLKMLERGDRLESVVPLVDEAATYTSPYDRLSIAYLAACRAVVAVRSGNREQATELAAEALRVADATHELWHRADLRLALSVVPRATGDQALERRMLQEAAPMYQRKEIRSYDAEIQRRLAVLGREGP
jgi:class 3 adenylate cyclase/tetratricopeptide (TPR) repeat protein